jgi:hypothetical protein
MQVCVSKDSLNGLLIKDTKLCFEQKNNLYLIQ